MLQDFSRFFIPLPNSSKELPQTRRRSIPETEGEADWEEITPYLRGLPTMPDFLAHLSVYRVLTAAEEECLGRHIDRVSSQIREARERWEAEKFDAETLASEA